MRKIFTLLVFTFLLLLITGCGEGSVNKEKELERLLNADSLDVTILTQSGANNAEYLNIVSSKKGISIRTTDRMDHYSNKYIIIDKNNNLFVDFIDYMGYTNLENKPFEDVDIDYYISNMRENNEGLTFDVKANDLFEDTGFAINDVFPMKDIQTFTCLFENNKVSQLEYLYYKTKIIFQINSYNDSERVNIPDKDDCVEFSKDELLNILHKGISCDISKYTFILDNPVINIKTNENINREFIGCIYDTVSKNVVKEVSSNEIKYEEKSFSEGGKYKINVNTTYQGKDFKAEAYVNVTGDIKITNSNKVKGSNDFVYGFSVDNNVYLCDKRYIYKYDYECNELLGKLDLKCEGNSYFVKGNYLYVAGNFPYTTTYNDEYSYEGSVTKIEIEDFTIVKQVNVNSLPNSIVVDNRDNVIISKKANQHVSNEVVNMETGELTKAFSGYQNDTLVYDPNRDYLVNLTNGHSGDNELYEYKNGNWLEKGICSIAGYEVYTQNRGLIITRSGVYKYNGFSDNYVNLGIKLNDNERFDDTEYITSDGEKAYIIKYKYSTSRYIRYLISYDLITKEYEKTDLPEINNDVVCSYLYSGYLFIISEDGTILKLKVN